MTRLDHLDNAGIESSDGLTLTCICLATDFDNIGFGIKYNPASIIGHDVDFMTLTS